METIGKLLAITGPTSTGKTALGVFLAKKFNGEIVSADSRQVYRGMDILTGKDLDKDQELVVRNFFFGLPEGKITLGFRTKEGIPVWLVDVVEPDYPFNVKEYTQLAKLVVQDIWKRKKLPIVVGGTGLYIKSLIDPLEDIFVPPDNDLREVLEKVSSQTLQEILQKVDFSKWEKMNHSDRNNPRRLIRAIEIAYWRANHPGESLKVLPLPITSFLFLGLKAPLLFLDQKIRERVEKRIKEGVIEEVKKLKEKGYPKTLRSLTATGYKILSDFIEGKENFFTAVKSWQFAEQAYARRQLTFFFREKRVIWFDIREDYLAKIESLVEKWYTTGEAPEGKYAREN